MKRDATAQERVVSRVGLYKPVFFTYYLKIEGNITPEKLQTALKKSATRYPVAGAKLKKGIDNEMFLTSEDSDDFIISTHNIELSKWKEIVHKELNQPFDPYSSPMVRAAILHDKSSSQDCGLIINFQHAISDGSAGILLIDELLKNLADKNREIEIENKAPTAFELLPQEMIDKLDKTERPPWLREDDNDMELKTIDDSLRVFTGLDFKIDSWCFDAEKTTKIVKRTKQLQCTVNSFFAALLLRAYSIEFGEKEGYERGLQCPCDLKRYFKKDDKGYYGNYNGIIKTRINCDKDRPIGNIATDIGTELSKALEDYEFLSWDYHSETYGLSSIKGNPEELYDQFILLHNEEEDDENTFHKGYDFSLSNMGCLALNENYGEFTLKEIYGPTFSAMGGERVFGVNSFAGKIFFTHIYDKATFDEKAANRILDSFFDLIDKEI